MRALSAGHPRSGLTRLELLVTLAILVMGALILIPSVKRTRCTGSMGVHCANNLKQIYAYAVAHADRSKTGRFPTAPGKSPRAHESLNEIIAFDAEGLSPRLFVCPSSDHAQVEPDGDGRFLLSGTTSSYAWTAIPLEVEGPPRPLASDKYAEGFEDANGRHSGHRGGMNVLYTDGSVRFVHEEDLDPETGLPPGLRR